MKTKPILEAPEFCSRGQNVILLEQSCGLQKRRNPVLICKAYTKLCKFHTAGDDATVEAGQLRLPATLHHSMEIWPFIPLQLLQPW